MDHKLIITPKTKVGELLDSYPELEEPLIEIAPAFKKLKNPVLRKTIAKITSLEQAAMVGEVSVDLIVNRLRKLTGQDEMEIEGNDKVAIEGKPDWFSKENIRQTHDARDEIAKGGHPLGTVMSYIHSMQDKEIYEIITPFYPAPMVDRVKEKGLKAWSYKENEGLYRNYFCKI